MTSNTWTCGLAVCLLSLTGIATAGAVDDVEIQLADVDIVYDSSTGTITNAGAPSDSLDGLFFFFNNTPVGSLVSPPEDLTFDLLIPGVPAIPAAGGSVVSAPGGTLRIGSPGTVLILDLGPVDVIYTPGGGFDFIFVGTDGTVTAQNLPFDLGLDVTEPVAFTFSNQAETIDLSPTEVLSFTSSGTGELTGTFDLDPDLEVPEPTSFALLTIGFGWAAARRR